MLKIFDHLKKLNPNFFFQLDIQAHPRHRRHTTNLAYMYHESIHRTGCNVGVEPSFMSMHVVQWRLAPKVPRFPPIKFNENCSSRASWIY